MKNIFPKIHLKATQKELEYYKKCVLKTIKAYNIPSINKMLEVGCGGRAAGIYALKDYHPGYHGIDINEENVINTRKLCKKFGFEATVEYGDALNLAFDNNSFDFVFSDGVIHHTTSPLKCFLEMVRVLKPKGYLFLGIYAYGGIWGKIIHPLGMLLGKTIPFKLTEKFVNLTGFLRTQEHSLLDWFYTPIQKKHKVDELLYWFKEFDEVQWFRCPKWYYSMGILTFVIFGSGYIYIIGRKKNEKP